MHFSKLTRSWCSNIIVRMRNAEKRFQLFCITSPMQMKSKVGTYYIHSIHTETPKVLLLHALIFRHRKFN